MKSVIKYILFSVLIFCSAYQKHQDKKWTSLRDDSVLQLAETNVVYQQFKKELSNEALEYYLHNDPLSHMRAYAFFALLDRRVDNLEELMRRHLDDTEVVLFTVTGTSLSGGRMNDLMLYSMDTANYPVVQCTYQEYAKQVLPYQVTLQVDIEVDSSDLVEEW